MVHRNKVVTRLQKERDTVLNFLLKLIRLTDSSHGRSHYYLVNTRFSKPFLNEPNPYKDSKAGKENRLHVTLSHEARHQNVKKKYFE